MSRWERSGLGFAALFAIVGLAMAPANAQQVTGKLGSADATTTIDGKQIPPPPPKFGGVIKESRQGFHALVAAARRAAEGRPQRPSDHDGRPGLWRAQHLRRCHPYAGPRSHRQGRAALHQFHSTALCSPTRAALITGRNHHSVGFGVIGELSTGYPGYDSVIGQENATIAEILKENGYATSWFGKNHNTPGFNTAARQGRLTNGQSEWASSTSMASWAARLTSGRPTSSAIHGRVSVGRQERLQPHH